MERDPGVTYFNAGKTNRPGHGGARRFNRDGTTRSWCRIESTIRRAAVSTVSLVRIIEQPTGRLT
ncbi:MAG: hypothetical protein P8181_10905, partial [bacterium]